MSEFPHRYFKFPLISHSSDNRYRLGVTNTNTGFLSLTDKTRNRAMLRIRDIMTRDVMTLAPEMTLREAMENLTARNVSGAPVVSGQKVVGVISASDLLLFAAAPPRDGERWAESVRAGEFDETAEWSETLEAAEADDSHAFFTDMWDDHTEGTTEVIESRGESSPDPMENYLVEDVMTKMIRWLSPDADVRSAADMMREFGVHRVLVLNRGHLVGLVSAMDIAKAVAERQLPNRSFVFDSSPVKKAATGLQS